MAKKKKAQYSRRKQPVQKQQSNFWKILAIVAVILLVGVTAKTLLAPNQNTAVITTIQPTGVQASNPLPANPVEDQVRLVATNFKCACGGCGELPLAECECSMPRGAVEEKSFIRTKLIEGYSVPQVIELVEKKYGHRAT
jgi:hypothetical protein